MGILGVTADAFGLDLAILSIVSIAYTGVVVVEFVIVLNFYFAMRRLKERLDATLKRQQMSG